MATVGLWRTRSTRAEQNSHPGFAENRYDVVAANRSKNRKKWFIFHWDSQKNSNRIARPSRKNRESRCKPLGVRKKRDRHSKTAKPGANY